MGAKWREKKKKKRRREKGSTPFIQHTKRRKKRKKGKKGLLWCLDSFAPGRERKKKANTGQINHSKGDTTVGKKEGIIDSNFQHLLLAKKKGKKKKESGFKLTGLLKGENAPSLPRSLRGEEASSNFSKKKFSLPPERKEKEPHLLSEEGGTAAWYC